MTKHLKIIALAGLLTGLVGFESIAQVGTLFDNYEVTDYISSMQDQDFTYLVWDRNYDGDGSFVDATRPMFFYWDNDDSRLGFLIDTRNMSKLKASFNDLKLAQGLSLNNGYGITTTAGASIFTGTGGQTFSIQAGGSGNIVTFMDGPGVERARFNEMGYLGIGISNPTSPISLAGIDDTSIPDISVNSHNSLISLGAGQSGPHGLTFGDPDTGGLQFVYRSTPNQLIVEKTNTGGDGTDLFSIDFDTEYSYFKGKVGIGTQTPEATFHTSSNAVLEGSTAKFGANMLIQGSSSTRSTTEGAALGFVVPANTDGSNPWQQGRILVTPDNNNTGRADGRMYLQTRYFNGSVWTWKDNLVLFPSGDIGIGTTNTHGYKLAVKGAIITEEVKVELSTSWPDYVFTPSYDLQSLDQVETFINKNGHLPNIPSSQEVEENNGIELGEMNAKLLEKIEELTLHLIQQNKELSELKTQNSNLIKRIEKIESSVEK